MNIAVAFVIICCLLVTELTPGQPVEDVWTRVVLVFLMMAAVPSAALFQTWFITRRKDDQALSYKQQQTILERLSVCHTAVWFCSSLAIVYAARWQDVVRIHFGIDWPLVDELLILAPILFAVVASWAIFFEIEKFYSGADVQKTDKFLSKQFADLKKRFAFVSIRFRVSVLMILVPLMIVLFAKDILPTGPPEKVLALGAVFAICIAAIYPFLILLIWKTEKLANPILDQELLDLCRAHKVGVRSIRVWKTNRQILNAAIIGIIPGLRVIVLTDTMLSRFSKPEIRAIVRHEAGHIRMNHFMRRMVAILLPLLILFVDQQLPFGIHAILENRLIELGQPKDWAVGIISGLYIAYLWMISTTMFKRMEFEADYYSATTGIMETPLSGSPKLGTTHAEDLISALRKFAVYCPDQYSRSRGLHPSLQSRINSIIDIGNIAPASQ